MKVKSVYEFLNGYAPFHVCDSFDNCGLIVGSMDANVKAICLCLDITNKVIEEAAKRKANLIISHHPVIFNPLKRVEAGTPVYNLIKYKMNAICMHTNADMTKNGVTDIMLELLDFENSGVTLEPKYPDGTGYGKIIELPIPTTPKALAESCKKAFDCTVVRYVDTDSPISKVAVCSGAGAGGGNLQRAIDAGCQALIWGDVKHDVWIDAENNNFCLIDAGHFHTENILCNYLSGILSRKFHKAEIFVAENSKDPCSYV